MALFSEVMAALAADGSVEVPPEWMQGRTTYGGMSAAVMTAATAAAHPDLPPLRTAQFMLIGPAGGRVTTRIEPLRRGRSTVVVQADLLTEDGALAARALLGYGAARESTIAIEPPEAPAVPPPEGCEDAFAGRRGPTHAAQFEVRRAGGSQLVAGDRDPTLLVWARHRDPSAGVAVPALLAVGDLMPPASMVLASAWAPISTLTWSVDLLDPSPTTEDGWWLLRATAESAADGWSPQTMSMWSRAGRLVLSSRQMVAVFA